MGYFSIQIVDHTFWICKSEASIREEGDSSPNEALLMTYRYEANGYWIRPPIHLNLALENEEARRSSPSKTIWLQIQDIQLLYRSFWGLKFGLYCLLHSQHRYSLSTPSCLTMACRAQSLHVQSHPILGTILSHVFFIWFDFFMFYLPEIVFEDIRLFDRFGVYEVTTFQINLR